MQDSTRTIFLSARRFFSGTLISRVTGLAREVAMAAVFGTHPAIAAFWMAFRFSQLLRRLFGEGALHAAFVPHFESLRRQDSALGARFFFDLSRSVAICLCFMTLLIEVILGALLLNCHFKADNHEVIRLTMIMLPALLFISLYALNTSLLNCEKSFFWPSVAPSALNIMWLMAILFVYKQPIAHAVERLAMLIVLSFAMQWLITLPQVYRYLSQVLGEKWREKKFSGSELLKVLRPFALGILGVGATQVNSALDVLFARASDSQGPAYLWYALRIQQLPLALFGLGLTGALLPPIARAIQQKERNHYFHFLNYAFKKSILILIPMTAALFSMGFSIINLIYGHGEFSHKAIIETTRALWAYGLALLPMTLILIFAAAFYAQKNYKVPTMVSLFSVGLNGVLNGICVFYLNMGPVSIALATSLCAGWNCLFLGVWLKKMYGCDLSGVKSIFFKVSLASLFAAAVTIEIGAYVFQDNTLFVLTKQQPALFHRELFYQMIPVIGQAFCFGVVFLVAASLLRIPEISKLFMRVRSKT